MKNEKKKEEIKAMVFETAKGVYEEWGELRRRRARLKSFTYGRQWEDLVRQPDGSVMTEREQAERSGAHPITNNLLRQLVKSVVGRFRARVEEEPRRGPGATEIARRNHLDLLDARMMEEFLISGCAIQRIVKEKRPGGEGVWVDNISPDRFFCNVHTDPRGDDIDLIGCLHEMTLAEVLMRYGGESRERQAELCRIYKSGGFGGGFEVARNPRRCRVIEVWTLDSGERLQVHDPKTGSVRTIEATEEAYAELRRENNERRKAGEATLRGRREVAMEWRGRMYAPDGSLLGEHRGKSHPFALTLYPLIDGEVHSFVEDIVDQQRHVNRLITLIDHIMATSAKGALLFPVGAKVESWSWEDYTRQWSRPGGMIIYEPGGSGGLKPETLTAGGNDAGAAALLQTELRLMEQISGVSHALQGGRSEETHTSANLYNAQAENALTSLRDIFETFDHFRRTRNEKIDEYGGAR